MSYFHCGNGYPDRCNGYRGPLDERVCTSGRHKYDESGRQVPLSFVSAADLLDPEPLPPMEFEKPDRPSSLRGRPIPRRGHGASEGDPTL